MKRICMLIVCVALAAACTADDPIDAAAPADSAEETATTARDETPNDAAAEGEPATDAGADPSSTTVTTTVGVTETTSETIPQTTIDNGAPETSGPVVTDPPAIEEPVPPVELQAYTDEIAVACAKVEFVYLGLRDGFDVDPGDLAEGATLAEAEDPARYGEVSADLIDASPGEQLALADAFLDVCADQGYERL